MTSPWFFLDIPMFWNTESGGWEGKIHLICTSSNPEKEQLWEKSGRQVFFCSALKWFVPSSELGAIVQNCLLRDIFF